jgi:hypothetical protein
MIHAKCMDSFEAFMDFVITDKINYRVSLEFIN